VLDPNHNASPLNPIPPIVGALVCLIGVIELGLQMGEAGLIGPPQSTGWRLALAQSWGFSDQLFDWMRLTNTYEFNYLLRFVTYPFVHQAFTHALFACVLLLAIGKFVGERFYSLSVLAIFFFAAIIGAIAFSLLADEGASLIGAYPGVYGLLGAFTWILWSRPDQSQSSRLAAFQLVGFLLAMQLLFRAIVEAPDDWIADLFGFIAGFLLSFVMSPGGGTRIRQAVERARERR